MSATWGKASKLAVLILTLALASGAFGKVCNSASPNVGNEVSVSPPIYTAGDTLFLYSSAFVSPDALFNFKVDQGPQVSIFGAGYVNAITGSGATGYILNAPEGIGDVVVSWGAEGNLNPTITVCDIGPTKDILVWGSAPSIGESVYELPSGWYQSVRPATLIYCIGGGLTEVQGWTADTANGWYTIDGASTDHTFCMFRDNTKPWVGKGKGKWFSPEILHAYGLIAGWAN